MSTEEYFDVMQIKSEMGLKSESLISEVEQPRKDIQNTNDTYIEQLKYFLNQIGQHTWFPAIEWNFFLHAVSEKWSYYTQDVIVQKYSSGGKRNNILILTEYQEWLC